MKTFNLFIILVLVVGLALVVGLVPVAQATSSTIEVSQPVQVTNDSHYERGQAIVFDGTNYWLFYGRSASVTGNYQNDNPDVHDYAIYYKKASSVTELAGATANAVPGATDSYLGEIGAAVLDGTVWTFATLPSINHSGRKSLYGWYTSDEGGNWTRVADLADNLPPGAAHHDEVAFNNELYVMVNYPDGNTGWHTKHTADPTASSINWSSYVPPNSTANLINGTGHFFVDDGALYIGLLRTSPSKDNKVLEYSAGPPESWTELASASSTGWDPTLFKVGSSYVLAQAPWSNEGGGRQYIIAWSGSSLSNVLDGSHVMVSAAKYGTNTWVDMWPIGFTDNDGKSYLFFTSERKEPGEEGTGNIWYLPVTWDVTNDHYTYIQNAIDAATSTTINVAAGTYNESVTINKDNLTMLGDSSSRPEITGGLKFDTDLTGLTFKNFYVTGNAVSGENSVVRMYGAITDLTIDNCVFDGENISGRLGFSGGQLEGDVTVTNSEFKRILGWALFESRSGSGGDGSAMDTVTFAGNHIHDSNGSVVFRGLSTDRTDVVNAYGNTWDNIGGNAGETGQHWAALEVNRAMEVNVSNNTVNDVALGQWGEGQAFQFWNIDELYVCNNDITNNAQGIFIYGDEDGGLGGPFAVPGGYISFNNIAGNTQYGISVDSAATGGPLDAEDNWWGTPFGPNGENPAGKSVKGSDNVSENVEYDPWLKKPFQANQDHGGNPHPKE